MQNTCWRTGEKNLMINLQYFLWNQCRLITYHDNHCDYSGYEECTFVVLKGFVKFVKATSHIKLGVQRIFSTIIHLSSELSTTRFWDFKPVPRIGSKSFPAVDSKCCVFLQFCSTAFQLERKKNIMVLQKMKKNQNHCTALVKKILHM